MCEVRSSVAPSPGNAEDVSSLQDVQVEWEMTKEQFWMNVRKDGDCWPWMRCKYHDGYGHVWFNSRNERAHRVAYMLAVGPIPCSQDILHSCDNPPCCRPDHLFSGTQEDNARDMVRKGRNAKGDQAARKGEKNRRAKLTDQKIREIRRRAASGELQISLAREFKVGSSNMSRIVRRINWRHIVDSLGGQ